VGIPEAYLAGEGPFPERLPWIVLCGQLLQEVVDAVDRWATWARAVVEAWPDDVTQATADRAALEAQVAAAERHRAARRPEQPAGEERG
jgi:hypothetical protein